MSQKITECDFKDHRMRFSPMSAGIRCDKRIAWSDFEILYRVCSIGVINLDQNKTVIDNLEESAIFAQEVMIISYKRKDMRMLMTFVIKDGIGKTVNIVLTQMTEISLLALLQILLPVCIILHK